VQCAAETGFAISDKRDKPVDSAFAFGMIDLICADESVVQATYQGGYGVSRVKALVGIHLAGVIGVGGGLPAADVDCLESSCYHLHCLVAAHSSQRLDIVAGMQQLP